MSGSRPRTDSTARLILASASPRRRELLSNAGFDFEVVPSNVNEESFSAGRPEALARRIARAKALDVASHHPGAVVLAADTIVVLRGEVLNKPQDAAEARRRLTRLRDRWHRVITAICVAGAGRRVRVEHAVTRVYMRSYGDEEIEATIVRGDPFDKAGAYAIQDPILAPVASYEGCYCNVVGLPLWNAIRMLSLAGIQAAQVGFMSNACKTCVMKSIDHGGRR